MAGNWTLAGTASERFEANSNLRLEEDGEPLFGSITALDFVLGYDTPRTEWEFGSGASFREYIGPGDAEGLEGFSSPRASAAVVHRHKRQVFEADFAVLRQALDFTRLDQLELTEETTDETRIDFGAEWSWLAGPRDTFSLGTDLGLRRFSEEAADLAPSTSVQVFGSWSRLVDPRTEAGLSLSYRNFTSDGELTDLQTDVVTLSASATRRLTPRHTISIGLGPAYTWSDRTTLLPVEAEGDPGLSFQGDLDFAWLGPGGLEVGLTAVQAFQPTAQGTLANTTSFGAQARKPLTPRTGLRLNADYSQRTEKDIPGRDDTRGQLLRLAAGLNTDLTRLWDAAAGVDFRYLDEDEGSAHSFGMFFELRREFVLNR